MATTIATAELSKNVTTFLNKPKRMLIGGAWIDSVSGKSFQTYNPAAGEPLARVAEGDRADIDPAVKAARKAFEGGPWPNLSPSDRGRLLWKLADLLEQQLEEFAELESLDNGKPLSVARVADVPLAVDLFRYMAGWTTKTTRFPSLFLALNILLIPCVNRSALSARLFCGISRC